MKPPVRVISINATFKDGQSYNYDFVITKGKFTTFRKPEFVLSDVQHITIDFKTSTL
jgi:hypothetical protein